MSEALKKYRRIAKSTRIDAIDKEIAEEVVKALESICKDCIKITDLITGYKATAKQEMVNGNIQKSINLNSVARILAGI